jgi:hypothetical protein
MAAHPTADVDGALDAHGQTTLELSSELAAPRPAVWATVSAMRGVNAELFPFVRMTHPRALPSITTVDPAPGTVLFHSWLLLFGVLPFDRHALALEEVSDGEGFVEDSTSWLQRRWRHERRLTDRAGGGCVVTDRLTIEPRLALTKPLEAAIVRRLFDHRHRRLRQRFGAC